MIILVWNCRGIGNPAFRHNMKDICHCHTPHIVCLLETRSTSSFVDNLPSQLGFSQHYRVPSDGYAGGLWLMWKDSLVSLTMIHSYAQCIHTGVLYKNKYFLISFSYVRPQTTFKQIYWSFLQRIHT